MKLKTKTKSNRHKKNVRATHGKRNGNQIFRACEINSLFQFGSMDILIFYALHATYVRAVSKQNQSNNNFNRYSSSGSSTNAHEMKRITEQKSQQIHVIWAKIKEPIKRSMNFFSASLKRTEHIIIIYQLSRWMNEEWMSEWVNELNFSSIIRHRTSEWVCACVSICISKDGYLRWIYG